jgi:acetoin utilization protein AcuB
MLVKYWMKKDVPTLDAGDSMQQAIGLMKTHETAVLPVLRKDKLIGILTDRDLKRASASDATSLDMHELIYLLSRIKVAEIMTKNPITVPPDFTLEETASILLKNKISGVPVMLEGKLVGLITQADLFRALISLTGFEKRGIQIALRVEDKAGSIKEATDIVRGYGGRLVSILTSYDRASPGFRHVYIRTYGINREVMKQMVLDLQDKAEVLYMVDLKENIRKEYVDSEVTKN